MVTIVQKSKPARCTGVDFMLGFFKKATAGCVKNGNGKQTVWWVVSLSRENIADGIPRAGIYRLDIELKIYPKGPDRANTRYTIRKQGEMSTILQLIGMRTIYNKKFK